MKKILLSVIVLFSCQANAQYLYPFQNPALSYQKRVENLISLFNPRGKSGTDDE